MDFPNNYSDKITHSNNIYCWDINNKNKRSVGVGGG